MDHPLKPAAFRDSGFTLVEMMVALTLLLIMLGVIFKITQFTADTWKNSTGKTEAFRDARGAFEAMTRTLSQATLNTYFDYVDAATLPNYRDPLTAASFVPDHYARRSDLHFICGKSLLPATSSVTFPKTHAVFFQAPLGYSSNLIPYSETPADPDTKVPTLDGVLNACGFYLHYGQDLFKPGFLSISASPERNRFRLMQFTQPAESLSIYSSTITNNSAVWNSKNWFITPLAQDLAASATAVSLSQLAENVVALIILPKYSKSDQAAIGRPLSSNYEYDSRDRTKTNTLHQLPPIVQSSW